jgi:hypothetical protein
MCFADRAEFLRIPTGKNNHSAATRQFGDDKPAGVTRRTENDDRMIFGKRGGICI